MVDSVFPRQITVRVADENSKDGFAYEPAFLIHPNICVLRHGDFIEFYKLTQAEGEEIYEMVTMLPPFEFRNKHELNFDQMVNDAATLSFGEFWNRYIEVFS